MSVSIISSKVMSVLYRIFGFFKNKPGLSNPRGITAGICAYGSSSMEIDILVEEELGEAANDLKVSVITPEMKRLPMTFDAGKGLYTGVAVFPACGEYRAVIEIPEAPPLELRFEHHPLTAAPQVIYMIDEKGAGTITGNRLNVKERILIAWEPLPEIVMYEGQILKDGHTIHTFHTYGTIFSLKENLLPPGSEYTLLLRARQTGGDPLLVKKDYYSDNYSESSEFIFQTK